MAKLIEQKTYKGVYDLSRDEIIVELSHGRRVYITDGYGGERSIAGGAYRWRHGLAIQILPTDTLESLHNEDFAPGCYVTQYYLMIHGEDKYRPILDWTGVQVDNVAVSATK